MHPRSRLRPTSHAGPSSSSNGIARPHLSLAATDSLRVSFRLWGEDVEVVAGGGAATDDDEYDLSEFFVDGHLKLMTRLHGPPPRPADDVRETECLGRESRDEHQFNLMWSFDPDDASFDVDDFSDRSSERLPDRSNSYGSLVGLIHPDGTKECNRKRWQNSQTKMFTESQFAVEFKRRLSSVRCRSRAAEAREQRAAAEREVDRNEFRRVPVGRRRRTRSRFACCGRRSVYERCGSNRAE